MIVRELRKIPELFEHLSDPSTGALVFREGGPAMKALENLIILVKSGKLSGEAVSALVSLAQSILQAVNISAMKEH